MAEVTIQVQSQIQSPSLQIGDFAFYQLVNTGNPVKTANNPIYVGPITDLGDTYIKVDTSLDPSTITGFLMYSKSKVVNNSSLNGYYAEVTFRNNDPNNKSEIFAISSDVSQSSK
tara:strand:+ start:13683 stop:14027 length:345 start_codon:yes stop_codon:yes gene_type:complete